MQILTHNFTNLDQRQDFSASVTKFRKTRITPLQNIVYRNFLPHFFFNSDTFWRCDTACWSHGRAKNQVWANQNSGHYDIKLLYELYVNAVMTKEYFENLKIIVFRFQCDFVNTLARFSKCVRPFFVIIHASMHDKILNTWGKRFLDQKN